MAHVAARTGALLGVLAGALAAALIPAGPAYAEEAEFRIRAMPAELQIGGEAGTFQARVTNSDDRAYAFVRLVITVRMSALETGQVVVSRDGQDLVATGSRGTVRFADPSGFSLGRRESHEQSYQLRFLDGSPVGRALVTVAGYAPDSRRVGISRAATTLVGTGPVELTPSPSEAMPEATSTDGAETASGDPAGAASPASDDDSGLLWPVYLFGVLLVGAGVTVAWLALRRHRETAATAGPPTADSTLVIPRITEPAGYAGGPPGYRAGPDPRYGPAAPPGYGPAAPAPGYGSGPGYAPGPPSPAPGYGPPAAPGYGPPPGYPGGSPPGYGPGASPPGHPPGAPAPGYGPAGYGPGGHQPGYYPGIDQTRVDPSRRHSP
ncbi:MAG TPA: hypothetical protein VFM55_02175 [Micromonosporaceae bacterium]|nr:hypothetical protein [Micromonosporaceae bacterium]